MTTATLALPRVQAPSRARARVRPRHVAIENTLLWAVAFSFYIVAAVYLVLHLHYMIDDAYSRVDNAFDVLFTGDPHLAAIGFFWPPLPSFLEIPIIAFKNLWPPLLTQGFAGSIEAAAFSAGTVVLFNSGMKWAGVVRGMRWIICLIWMVNPMIVLFAVQGMSEAEFIFFFVAAALVFMRWAQSNRGALLPLLGILAGLDCLCRDEAFVFAAIIGVAVCVQCARRGMRPREIETKVLMYALPAVFVAMLWLGSAAIIMHDPLYVLNANHDTHAAGGVSRAQAYGLIHIKTWASSFEFVISRSVALFPAIVPLLILMGMQLFFRAGRVAGVMVILMGLCIPLLDVALLHGKLGPYLRYQISVIPFAFLVAVWLLRYVRGKRALVSSWMALLLAAVLGSSNVLTAQTLSDPTMAGEEQPALASLASGLPVSQSVGWYNAITVGPQETPQILRLDTDGGRILCDSTNCYPIVMNAPNPKIFVVTSDRNFEAAAAQPLVYGVEYFLVPTPKGLGAFNRLNVLYPHLYEDGGGFSTLVGEVDGSLGNWRLYRVTGPTGRG